MQTLAGSTILPEHVEVGNLSIPVDVITRYAFEESELSVDDWNDLAQIDREFWHVSAVFKMRQNRAVRFDA